MSRTTLFTLAAGALALAGCAVAPGPDYSLPPATPVAAAVAQPAPASATVPETVQSPIAPFVTPLPPAPPEVIGPEAPQTMPMPL